jgi:prepilin-type N-terminal cleavage/methylation domain-containing protein
MESHMTQMTRKNARRTGFTLIELLVVISIIGILVGLTLPGLQWARRSSKRAACLSNLKQIAIGTTAYLGDNNGILPHVLPLSVGNPGEEDLLEALDDYFTSFEVFTCPADDTGVSDELGSSYDYYPGWIMLIREMFAGDPPDAVARLTTIYYEKTPGKLPIMVDAESWHKPLDEVGRNASFWDASAGPLTDWTTPGWNE